MKKYSFERRQKERKVGNAVKQLKKVQWKYKNSILLIISVLFAYILAKNHFFEETISGLENFGYAGALFAGMFYTFSMTVAPSISIFYLIGKRSNPLFIAVAGATGSVLGDYLIFRFVKDKLVDEIKLISEEINRKSTFYFQNSIFYSLFPFSNLLLSNKFKILMIKISRSKVWRTFIKIVAGLIIASPLPDELGITLLGATKQKTKEFVVYSYLLNFAGIFSIAYLATG